MIQCKGHVIGLFRPAWPGQRAGSRRVTGRDVTQPAGDVPRVLSLLVFKINENRRENTILSQTLVRGAVMMIRPPTSPIDDRASEGLSFSVSIVSQSQASTSGVGHRNNRGWLDSYASHHWPLCQRWHAAWRASMTKLSMNQFNQTSGCRQHAACGTCKIQGQVSQAIPKDSHITRSSIVVQQLIIFMFCS